MKSSASQEDYFKMNNWLSKHFKSHISIFNIFVCRSMLQLCDFPFNYFWILLQ
eukprot:UN14202